MILFLIDIRVRQTPSQDTETPISLLLNLRSDFINILIPLGLLSILVTKPLLNIIPLNIDNPKLNCRLEGYAQHSPKRIILDKNLKIDLKSYVVKSIKNKNTIIFYNSNNRIKKNFLIKKGALLINQPTQRHQNFDLKKILKKLYMVGIKNLLVEGGDKLTKSFLQKRMFNEFYMFKSSKNLLKENKYVNFTSSYILNTKYDRYKTNFKLGTDKITIYKR